MRTLRVVGLDEGGKYVLCEDPAGGERFQIPADERLRAAARGDVTRLGQMAIELESQMRPREIQARIRAGESVDQVAAAANLPEHRVERYAYPVLLERSRTAELAQRAHPVREDGPDVQTLTEVAAHAFALRGHDYSTVSWDSWRGEDSRWVVQLRWRAGRSDNRAHWSYSPGAHGGTVVALDDNAFDIMEPNANRPLRTVRPAIPFAGQQPFPAPAREPEPEPEPEEIAEPEPSAQETTATAPSASANSSTSASSVSTAPAEPAAEQPAATETAEPEVEVVEATGTDQSGIAPPAREQATQQATQKAETPPAREQRTEPAAKRGKKGRPNVPSWEDVLLGVRSTRN
ncbi:MAG: septation protein SepH [Sciscionella sp.]